MGYVTRRRLFLAAEDLVGTKNSVLIIALKYGYDSLERFTRSFKAYLGVTPTEYRKYHSAIGFPGAKKEESAMLNSKTTDEIIRERNSLIVQAEETAADTRKQKGGYRRRGDSLCTGLGICVRKDGENGEGCILLAFKKN